MSKADFLRAREYIRQKRYSQARNILEAINHPLAHQWLEKLDRIDPVQPSAAQRWPWYEVWRRAIAQPSRTTFEQIICNPKAPILTAFLWIFAATFVGNLIYAVLIMVLYSSPVDTVLSVIAPFAGLGLVGTLMFFMNIGATQFLAKLAGGDGTHAELAYAFAAILAPISLIAIPVAQIGGSPLLKFLHLAIVLYGLRLEIYAMRAVNGFGQVRSFIIVVLGEIISLVLDATVGFSIVAVLLGVGAS